MVRVEQGVSESDVELLKTHVMQNHIDSGKVVSHRIHIGFEDSSKSEGVVTRHCHFAESLGIAANNCYICGNSKREYDYLSQYKRRFC